MYLNIYLFKVNTKKTILHYHDGDCVHIYKRILNLHPNSKEFTFGTTILLSLLISLSYTQENAFFLLFLLLY
jgi:hypothetical protein